MIVRRYTIQDRCAPGGALAYPLDDQVLSPERRNHIMLDPNTGGFFCFGTRQALNSIASKLFRGYFERVLRL